MDIVLTYIQALFKHMPEIALFLSLAVGYAIGKISFGKFQLGGVAGSLLAAIIVSQVGVHIDAVTQNILFALFIYAVGFTSGPQFFRSLGKKTLREIALALIVAILALAVVVTLSKLLSLDKGLAAGVTAGGMTQSAIMGTASDALSKLGQLGMLTAEQVKSMQDNIGIGFAVSYVFGALMTIIICANVLPKVMGTTLRDDAVKAEAALHKSGVAVTEEQRMAAPFLVGRLFKIGEGAGLNVAAVENASKLDDMVTVEKIKRGGHVIGFSHDLVLKKNDIVLLVGKRDAVFNTGKRLGVEVNGTPDMDFVIQTRQVVVTNDAMDGKSVSEIYAMADEQMRHGVYVLTLSRNGDRTTVNSDTVVEKGDIVTLYGSQADVTRVASLIGYVIIPSDKTDFVYLGIGIIVGLLIGLISVTVGGVPITLGSGGGALLAGLVFGWFRTKHMSFGELPDSAAQFLKDFGLAGFVAVIGLNSGRLAIETLKAHGVEIFIVGLAVTIIPLSLSLLVGRFILRYDNSAKFAGALAGAASATPALGAVLDKAGNSVPAGSFAITYALSNVFLTMLGPLVVALV